MCQPGWTTLLRHLIKHSSGCFCEGGFGLDLYLNLWTLIICPPWGWVSSSELKAFIENNWSSLSKTLAVYDLQTWTAWTWPWTAASAFLWVTRLPAYPAKLRLASLHNHVSQLFEISLSPYMYRDKCVCVNIHAYTYAYMHTHIQTHIHYIYTQ